MKIKKGDKVKIREDRLMKAYHYLKDTVYTVKNLQRRGNQIYVMFYLILLYMLISKH